MKETNSTKTVKPATPGKAEETLASAAGAAAAEARGFVAKDKAAATRALEGRIMARLAKRRLREMRREYEQARGVFRQTRLAALEAHRVARKAVRKARAESEAARKSAIAARTIADPTGKRKRVTMRRMVVPLPDHLSRLVAKPAILSRGGEEHSTGPEDGK
jgi:hypothetical protein